MVKEVSLRTVDMEKTRKWRAFSTWEGKYWQTEDYKINYRNNKICRKIVSIGVGYTLEIGNARDKKNVMYREETCAVTKSDVNRIIAAQVRLLRSIEGHPGERKRNKI
jgi:hypothetical protein